MYTGNVIEKYSNTPAVDWQQQAGTCHPGAANIHLRTQRSFPNWDTVASHQVETNKVGGGEGCFKNLILWFDVFHLWTLGVKLINITCVSEKRQSCSTFYTIKISHNNAFKSLMGQFVWVSVPADKTDVFWLE